MSESVMAMNFFEELVELPKINVEPWWDKANKKGKWK